MLLFLYNQFLRFPTYKICFLHAQFKKATGLTMLTLEWATTETTLNEAYQLRREKYEIISPHVNLNDERDALQDKHSIIFLLKNEEEPVATVRATPATLGMSLLDRLNCLPQDLATHEDTVEVSRVAAIPCQSGSIPYSLVALVAGARWLLMQTSFKSFFAYCRVPLARFYQAVGAQKKGTNFTINGYGDIKYTLVEGLLTLTAKVPISAVQLVMTSEANLTVLAQMQKTKLYN